MSAVRSVSLLWLASLVAAALALGTQVLLAHTLSPAQYGVYAVSVTLASILAPLAALGVPGVMLKFAGEEGAGAQRWLHKALSVVVLASIAVLGCELAHAWHFRADGVQRFAAIAMSPMVLSFVGAELMLARCQAEQRSTGQSVWTLLPNLMRALVAIAAFALGWRIEGVAVGIGAVSVAVGLVAMVRFARPAWRIGDRGHPSCLSTTAPVTLASTASQALPYAISAFVIVVFAQGVVLVAERRMGTTDAGVLSLALNLLMAIYLLPTVMTQRFLLSRFHRWATHEPDTLLRVYRAASGSLLLLGGVMGLGAALLAPIVIPRVFGAAYVNVGALLTMCSVAAPARFVASVAGLVLSTRHHMQVRIRSQLAAAAATLLAAWALMPPFGLAGAAAAVVAGEWLLMALYLWAVRQQALGPEAMRGWNLHWRRMGGSA